MKDGKFEVGDRIKCVNKEDSQFLEIGRIYTVSSMAGGRIQVAEGDYPGNKWELSWFKLVKSKGGTVKFREFKVGDKVVRVPGWEYINQDGGEGNIGKVVRDANERGWYGVSWPNGGSYDYQSRSIQSANNQTIKEERTMEISDNILEVFPDSQDAKKVAKRFGEQFGDNDRDRLDLINHKDALLKIIKDEEAEEAKKSK